MSTLCGMYFAGEYDEEVFAEYAGWLPFLDIFTVIVDGENGNFLHWPFEGAYMDQPYALMQVLKSIQTEYRKHLKGLMKRA